MRTVNIHEAKTHFSKLGPIDKKPKRKFGVLRGKIKVAKDFDAPLPDNILSEFER